MHSSTPSPIDVTDVNVSNFDWRICSMEKKDRYALAKPQLDKLLHLKYYLICYKSLKRRVCVEKFNVTFDYPWKDACSSCDNYKVELSKELPADELRRLAAERELHWRKSQVFYERKTTAAQEAQSSPQHAAAAFDFWTHFPCPNISTLDVYYKRQLSLCRGKARGEKESSADTPTALQPNTDVVTAARYKDLPTLKAFLLSGIANLLQPAATPRRATA
ncbi:hypothetical protein EGW08_004103 [Elysia chlorotica]|uniref:Uncharacterized protein n=1 Tax=Elysia chlorotica TaxID=188477 RepID=A0A3S1HXI5_ELYCH|nr:hypothetical protein EGW08_004103 [Elysia chlorotica]